jgi:hypothetical protein
MRRLHEDDLIPMGRELFIHRLARGGVPRIEGIAGAPFTIFHGEVSGDSDGPAEIAIEGLFAWALEQHRQPSGGVRSVLVFNPANQGAGPDTEFAVSLR